MNTAEFAQLAAPAPGAVQNLNIIPGVKLDQDGNRYRDAATKLKFLRDCLEAGIRSGNLQPITTVNQCNDLIRRIDEAAAQCGQPVLTEAEKAAALAEAGSHEQGHALKMRLEAKMRRDYYASRRHEDRHVDFDGHRAMAKIHAMSEAEILKALEA